MEISFDPQGGYWDASRGRVHFLAYVDGRLKPCWVVPPALEDLVEVPVDAPELDGIAYVMIFERCRESIQNVAAAKFRCGQIEDGGVVLHTDDMEHEHGKHGTFVKTVDGYWVDAV